MLPHKIFFDKKFISYKIKDDSENPRKDHQHKDVYFDLPNYIGRVAASSISVDKSKIPLPLKASR